MRKGKMFYKVFLPILVLGIGLVVSFVSYIYFNTAQSVNERVTDSKRSQITQVKNMLEHKIQTIEYTFNAYSTTPSFSQTVKNQITVKEFQAYREVNSQLNYLASMGIEGVEYTLISLVKDWQINSNGKLTYITQDEKKEVYENYINHQSRGLFWVKTATGIRFVNTLPVFSTDKQALALADIPETSLDRLLATESNSPLFITNRKGELLFANALGDEALKEDGQMLHAVASTAENDGGNTGQDTLSFSHPESYKAIYSRSSYNNWVYVTLLDPNEISEALQATRFGLIMMGVVISLFVAIAAYMIALRYNKPIQQIQRSLSQDTAAPAPKKGNNEIDWIISSIDTMKTEKANLESLIASELPQLETQFILNLFRGRITEEELAQNMERFGYTLSEDNHYMVMLIQLDNYGGHGVTDKDLLLLAVNKLVEEIVPEEQRMLPIILNDRTQATILMFRDMDDQEIRKAVLQYAKTIIKRSRDYLHVSVSIGVSNTQDTLLNSKEACEMGKQALHQRLNLGKESIIFYDDIATVVSGPVLLKYPTELESQLFDAIRLGDEERVSKTLYRLLAEMMKNSTNSMNFEVTLIRFVNNLIQLEQLIGVEVLLTQDNYALYHRLLDMRNPEEIERMLVEEVIQPMVRSMKEKTNQQFRCISDKIAAIIRAEYDQDLSLEMIGERLHYNPNYLSSIFKKEFGTTFSEYLMSYRLDIAKKWLVETDMTIKDIAERLQYHNPQNFIRSFRKKEDITPGSYRKLKQQY